MEHKSYYPKAKLSDSAMAIVQIGIRFLIKHIMMKGSSTKGEVYLGVYNIRQI